MYLLIANLLITMCFSKLIQILPTETYTSLPKSTCTKNHRQITTGNISKHTYSSKQLWAIHDQVNPTSLTNLPFRSIQNTRELQLNRKPTSIRTRKKQHMNPRRKAEIRNLRQVPTVDSSNDEIVWTIIVSTVNAKSLKHKENLIGEEIHNTNSDIVIITETWLKNTDEDDTWTHSSELNNDIPDINKK